jgi:3-dehydroquinate dehydratase-1
MPPRNPVKVVAEVAKVVGVICTAADLRFAARMQLKPDLFELRLDSLFGLKSLKQQISRLKRPLVITARHSAEGGENNLAGPIRRDLLLSFLPSARYVDIELRSAATCRAVMNRARQLGVGTIISFHDWGNTPSLGSLRAKATRAAALGAAVFKVATRTDTPAQLARLLQFVGDAPRGLPVSAMGIGKLGAVSRPLLGQCGSVLAYCSLRGSRIEGQLSVDQFRRTIGQLNPDQSVRLRPD